MEVYSKKVRVWLMIGLFMVLIQVVVGGITRLTESGLSITKWEVVSGTLPPLSESAWQAEYDLYKETPQYREINEGMLMADFKFIYFWEWVHRFWARLMGFVFLIPFLYFWYKGDIDGPLLRKLFLVVLLAALAAIFGWIMVASGLVQRPWVNAYKLAIHLSIAFAVFSALWWTYLWSGNTSTMRVSNDLALKYRGTLKWLTFIFIIQMLLGGILSGMKAAVVYSTWPDMNGIYFPSSVFTISEWKVSNFVEYDKNIFMPSLIHFLHRNTAYLLAIVGILFSFRLLKDRAGNRFTSRAGVSIISIISIQVILGILTVISSKGNIPVLLGTLHQAFALFLLASLIFTFFVLRLKK